MARRTRSRPWAPAAGVRAVAAPAAEKLATLLLWLVVLVPPLYFSPSAKESFRLPKLMVAEWLGLASLLPLAWELRRVETVPWRGLWRLPALRAALPLALVAAVGLATSSHPLHVRQALADLWIGAACLVGWSSGLPAARLERFIAGLLWPAAALAAVGILQSLGVQPLPLGGMRGGARLTITSLAGNPGDLGAFLVLPCLAAQWRLAGGGRPAGAQPAAPRQGTGRRREPGRGARGRFWLAAVLGLCAWALALTQTFAALAALLLGSLVFWAVVLAGRRRAAAATAAGAGTRLPRLWPVATAIAVAVAVMAAGAVAAVPALRARVIEKVNAARQGDWNAVLTGRFDGWRTALWMLAEHPGAGVGQGAYRAEFAPAKLALIGRGVAFHSGQQQQFVNAHDESLELAADCGVPGVLALAWGLAVLVAAVRARAGGQQPGVPGSGGTAASGAAARGAAATGGDAAGARGAAGRRRDVVSGVGASWRRHADRAFIAAGLAALGLLSLVDFPFRIALVAFPALLFLAWVLRPAGAEEAAA